MKIRISILDDNNEEYEGIFELNKKSLTSNGKNKIMTQTTINKNYKRLVGGINFLIKNNFFDKPQPVNEVQKELKREGYHYAITSTDKILRDFHAKKTLTRIGEDKKWNYVIRK